MKADLVLTLRHAAQGVSLGADGMGWSPDPALLGNAADEIERLRAALAELLACHTESAGWSMSMLADRAEFDAMLARSQERVEAAVGAARVALGPNVRGNGWPRADVAE